MPRVAYDKKTPLGKARVRTTPTSKKRIESLSPSQVKMKKLAGKNIEAVIRAKAVNPTTVELSKMKSPDRPLTDKQKLFVKHWAAGDSILGAAHQAGYSDGGTLAYRLVKDPAIIALYNAEKQKYEAAVGMTREKVMDGLAEAIEMARVMADPQAMIAGWREVGKMCGYYAPVAVKVDVNINDNTAYGRLNRMTDAELLELVKKDRLTLEMEPTSSTPLLEVRDVEDVDG